MDRQLILVARLRLHRCQRDDKQSASCKEVEVPLAECTWDEAEETNKGDSSSTAKTSKSGVKKVSGKSDMYFTPALRVSSLDSHKLKRTNQLGYSLWKLQLMNCGVHVHSHCRHSWIIPQLESAFSILALSRTPLSINIFFFSSVSCVIHFDLRQFEMKINSVLFVFSSSFDF